MTRLHLPHPSLANLEGPVVVTPALAGWTWSGLRVVDLAAGGAHRVDLADVEAAVLPLSGGCAVEVDGRTFVLEGRETVFAGVTDWVYLPPGSRATLRADQPCQVALPTSRAAAVGHPAVHVPAAEVPVEIRGAGQASREVHNFMAPGVFDGADKLMAVELLTPDGNWSSYPPHKHDASPECPVENEEIYYFRIGRVGTTGYAPEGFGLHRTYTGDGRIDATVTVRDGDVFCVPEGYHGPCIAPPGYPMYYLNVLAGPGGDRSMAFCDDPDHHWIRDSWEGQPLDPRLPMTPARVPRGS